MKRSPLSRSGRLRNRSRTNSRNHVNHQLYQDYIEEQNGECELHKAFPDIFREREACRGAHHIFHVGLRYDLWSNLIVVSQTAHRWIHDTCPIEGTLYSMLAKIRKGEANESEWDKAFGRSVSGWMQLDKVLHANVSVEHDREIAKYLGVDE